MLTLQRVKHGANKADDVNTTVRYTRLKVRPGPRDAITRINTVNADEAGGGCSVVGIRVF